PVGEEQHGTHEETAEEQEPQIGIARGEPALDPVHTERAEHRAVERAAPARGNPHHHLDRRQHPDLRRRDDADLPRGERPATPGSAGETPNRKSLCAAGEYPEKSTRVSLSRMATRTFPARVNVIQRHRTYAPMRVSAVTT